MITKVIRKSEPQTAAGPHVFRPKEFKVVALRQCPWRDGRPDLETPDAAADYWRRHVATDRRFTPELESQVVLLLNTRRRLLGHTVLSQGTKDTLLVHPGEALRTAVVANAAAVVFVHNHPSGDPTPSESDLKVARLLVRAGQALRIEVLDSLIMGKPAMGGKRDYVSLKELGYFGDSDCGEAPAVLSKAAESRTKPRAHRARRRRRSDGWVPAAESGIEKPESGRPVDGSGGGVLRHSVEAGFYLYDDQRECLLDGKPCGRYTVDLLIMEALSNPSSSGAIKVRFSYGPSVRSVKRLTRLEAIVWAIERYVPECFRADLAAMARLGEATEEKAKAAA